MSGCVLKSVLASAKFGKRSECRDEMSHKPRSLNSAHQALKPIIKVQRHTHTEAQVINPKRWIDLDSKPLHKT